jgi:hypothetical protein
LDAVDDAPPADCAVGATRGTPPEGVDTDHAETK